MSLRIPSLLCRRLHGTSRERTLAGVEPINSGRLPIQIHLQTNNISLAKVRFDEEAQIKVTEREEGNLHATPE